MRRLFTYFLCIFVAINAVAQVNVCGKVIGKDNELPLTGASVIVKDTEGKIKKYTSSKANGNYELNMNLMMGQFQQLYDHFLEFCSHTTAQRYLRLLHRYPRITEIASYVDIVSYLNISRRQLQRIN